MKKPRVGVDCDGVVADLLTPCFEVAERMLGKKFTIDQLHSWDLDSLIPPERLNEFWGLVGEPGICRNLTPYPGAKEGLEALHEVADVYIVTSYLHSSEKWVHERDAWFWEQFRIPRSKMVHTRAKYTFSAIMLVDDKPANLEEWASDRHNLPGSVPVLWQHPYNANHQFSPAVQSRIVATNQWSDVIDLVKKGRTL